ncbi:hypothetical protein OPIT5_13045 [Opitutaceae bacterium TAV5]|nr:hypothetical protein OPIT5_13045 [Opitutaceae bacterium TAV5]
MRGSTGAACQPGKAEAVLAASVARVAAVTGIAEAFETETDESTVVDADGRAGAAFRGETDADGPVTLAGKDGVEIVDGGRVESSEKDHAAFGGTESDAGTAGSPVFAFFKGNEGNGYAAGVGLRGERGEVSAVGVAGVGRGNDGEARVRDRGGGGFGSGKVVVGPECLARATGGGEGGAVACDDGAEGAAALDEAFLDEAVERFSYGGLRDAEKGDQGIFGREFFNVRGDGLDGAAERGAKLDVERNAAFAVEDDGADDGGPVEGGHGLLRGWKCVAGGRLVAKWRRSESRKYLSGENRKNRTRIHGVYGGSRRMADAEMIAT